MNRKYLDNLKGLDLLRFLLSLSVIVWHYQHFFSPYPDALADRNTFLKQQPYYSFFELFYLYGRYAVQIFWLISGVIFFKVYSHVIFSRQVSFRTFSTNRFSRLYPLQFLTVILVLILQQVYYHSHSSFFVYQNNSAHDFIFNLLFIQNLGAQYYSFNGPAWSVSIEILIYVLFFFASISGFLKSYRNILLTFGIIMIIKRYNLIFLAPEITQCLYFFFAGCIISKIIESKNKKIIISVYAGLFTILLCSKFTPSFLTPIWNKLFLNLDIELLAISILLVLSFIYFFLFTPFKYINSKYFKFFGDMTYSTYMIHFPVQLIMINIVKPDNYTFFFSGYIFLVYIFSVLLLGRVVFILIEMPIQRIIRSRLK